MSRSAAKKTAPSALERPPAPSSSKSKTSLQVPSSTFSFSTPRSSSRELRIRSPARLAPGFIATPVDGRRSPLRNNTEAPGEISEGDGGSNYEPDQSLPAESDSSHDDESDNSVQIVKGRSTAKSGQKRPCPPSPSTSQISKACPRSTVERKKSKRKSTKQVRLHFTPFSLTFSINYGVLH